MGWGKLLLLHCYLVGDKFIGQALIVQNQSFLTYFKVLVLYNQCLSYVYIKFMIHKLVFVGHLLSSFLCTFM